MKLRLFSILLLIVLKVNAHTPDANGVLYVKKGSTGDGASWNNAIGEVADALREAAILNNATPGTVKQIWVAAGTYLPKYRADQATTSTGSNSDRTNTFLLVKDVKMYGGFAGTETTINSRNFASNVTTLSGDIGAIGVINDNSYHVVLAAGEMGDAVFSGFTVSEGFSASGGSLLVNGVYVPLQIGGGIMMRSANLLIEDVIIANNSTAWGGGAACYSSTGEPMINVTFRRVNFLNNTASYAGALYITYANVQLEDVAGSLNSASSNAGMMLVSSSANVNCKESSFNNNSASGNGGAVSVDNSSTATFSNCEFLQNTANIGGGCIVNGTGSAIFKNSIIKGCISTFGAATALQGSALTSKISLINTLIAGNKATNSAANYVTQGTLEIINTTISGNTKEGILNTGGLVNVFNSILYGNETGISGTYIAKYSIVQEAADDHTNHITSVDPLFLNSVAYNIAPFINGDYRLEEASSAKNTGSNALYGASVTTDTDLTGNSRLSDNIIDLGAYERQAPLPVSFGRLRAIVQINRIKLDWNTFSETDNQSFIILRSINGSDYKEVTRVNSKNSGVNAYNYYDENPFRGTNYYRLLQKDIDGTTTFLADAVANFSLANATIKTWPNPIENELHIAFVAGKYDNVRLVDISGKVLQNFTLQKTQDTLVVSTLNYPKGAYVIELHGTGESYRVKVLK